MEGSSWFDVTVCFKIPNFSSSPILIVQLHLLPFAGTVVVSLGSVVDGNSVGVVSSTVVGLGVAVLGSLGATVSEKKLKHSLPSPFPWRYPLSWDRERLI